MPNSITAYKTAFSHLHVKVVDGRRFPNKAVLLVSIMELVRCGYIVNNRIFLCDTIRMAFEYNWRIYIGTEPPSVWAPFWHMRKESFWHFKPLHTLEVINKLARPDETASVGKMKREIDYAYLDEELFDIILTQVGRTELLSVLKDNFLSQ